MTAATDRSVSNTSGDEVSETLPLLTTASAWRRSAKIGLPLVAGLLVGGLLNEWASGRLPGKWRLEFLVGAILLASAAGFAAVLLTRTWRELRAAKELLAIATGNLAEAYDALVAANHSLAETAAARDRALAHLRAAIRERETFLASVSHDLRSPLTVIKGHADLLARHVRDAGTPSAEKLTDGLDRIAENARRLATMVDDLLWLARLEMDQQVDLQRSVTDLVALTNRLVADFAGATSRHRIRFRASVPRLEGWWDEKRLERVVSNLLSNAIKYSPEGGEIDVAVTSEHQGRVAVLRVADHGVGIPEEDLPHVFERFYRAENVGAWISGTGIGLSGVRQAVEFHGGTVAAESAVGRGSVFTIRLPVSADDPVDEAVDVPA